MPDGNVNVAAVIICLCLGFLLYFFPALMAHGRQHKHTAAIWVANLFFGWTVLGWMLLTVWAFMDQKKGQPQ